MNNRLKTVRCEKLILVLEEPVDEIFPEFSEWWADYIDEDEILFAERLRVEAVVQSSVLQKAESAFDKGFEPVIFSPNGKVDDKVFFQLGKFSTYVSRLVAGRDDETIRHFLMHPSLETVKAYAGHGQLIYPSLEYKTLFEKDLRYDNFAQSILKKLEQTTILLTDFRKLDDSDAKDDTGRPDFVERIDFEWYLDERRTVQIDFNNLSGDVNLYHRVNGKPCDDQIWLEQNGIVFEFDQKGRFLLTGEKLSIVRKIAQLFDLQKKYLNWQNKKEKLVVKEKQPVAYETFFYAMAAADEKETIAGERKDQSGEWTLRIFTDRENPDEGYVLLEICKERIKEFEGKIVTLDIDSQTIFTGKIKDGEAGKEISLQGLKIDAPWKLQIDND